MKNDIHTYLANQEVFSRNLKRLLDKSGKQQKEVARDLNLSSSSICDWLKCRAYPKMDKIQLLAEYFGVQVSDLVDDVNIAKDTITDMEQEVLDLFHKVPKEKREFVLSLIRLTIDNL